MLNLKRITRVDKVFIAYIFGLEQKHKDNNLGCCWAELF
uniref:Uncharacterized protein n=1 Tax=Tetranychus urticae TaxID=32264 RepID=T1KRY7_TETUR